MIEVKSGWKGRDVRSKDRNKRWRDDGKEIENENDEFRSIWRVCKVSNYSII